MGLRGNVRIPPIAHWKARDDFLFAVIELFSLSLQLRCYKRKSIEVGVY